MIILCGQRNIPLRGHRETNDIGEDPDENDGNFRGLVRLVADCGDEKLSDHLRNAPKNAVYTSPSIQNEIISVIAEFIRGKIVKNIKSEGGLYAILADETQDISTIEQLSLCLRYVSEGKIREEFVGFVDLFEENFSIDFNSLEEGESIEPKMTGKKIGQTIVEQLKELGLSIEKCVGQGYDGAASMSSRNVGAASVILSENPCALYSHCVGHVLNLAVISSSKVQAIRYMMGVVREVVTFLNISAKRLALFIEAVEHCFPGETKTRLKSLCDTRWVERHEAIEVFITLLQAIKLTLSHVSYNTSEIYKFVLKPVTV